jgi:hypothetical protein
MSGQTGGDRFFQIGSGLHLRLWQSANAPPEAWEHAVFETSKGADPVAGEGEHEEEAPGYCSPL